ncbi:MAG: hypothetical protein II661_00570 [Bacteroidales bacterium]|nr:hypothetical protein [Clostridia bacterium]MBQ3948943.1 hypothetical protein [Bacteroidales bacterium]
MTVKELIEELSECNQDATVWTVYDGGYGAIFPHVNFRPADDEAADEYNSFRGKIQQKVKNGDLLFEVG